MPAAAPVSELVSALEPAAGGRFSLESLTAAWATRCTCAERAFCLHNLAEWASRAYVHIHGRCTESARVAGQLQALNDVIRIEAARADVLSSTWHYRWEPKRVASWDQLDAWAELLDGALTLSAFMVAMPIEYSLERRYMLEGKRYVHRYSWVHEELRERGQPGTLAEAVADARRAAALAGAKGLCEHAEACAKARLEAGEVILGFLLGEPNKLMSQRDALAGVAEAGLTVEDFSEPHRTVFAAMMELADRQQPIDAGSLAAATGSAIEAARDWELAVRDTTRWNPDKSLSDLLRGAGERLRRWAAWFADAERMTRLEQARALVARQHPVQGLMALSSIEWTNGVWNPVKGCDKVSPGCKHCYAKTFAERFRGVAGHPYEHGFDLRLAPHKLDEPLRWRKPRRIFVNSMSDLFHEGIADTYIDQVVARMLLAPWHTFQLLTKRAERLPAYFNAPDLEVRLRAAAEAPQLAFPKLQAMSAPTPCPPWLWLGVSVEDRKFGLPRIDQLRRVPAAVRFLSIEPLLEDLGELDLRGIAWVILGGESGPGARPCELAWIRAVILQCRRVGVAVFVKQLGTVCLDGGARLRLAHPKGGDPAEWPEDLRVREYPTTPAKDSRVAAVYQVDGPAMRHVEVYASPSLTHKKWQPGVQTLDSAGARAADEVISGAPGDAPLHVASSTPLRWTGKAWLPDE